MHDEQAMTEAIGAIKATQNRLAMFIGIGMGVLLLVYFMTFSMLVDRGASGVLWFQGLSTVAFVIGFFFLNRLCFYLALLRHARHYRNQDWYVRLNASHAGKRLEDVVRELST